MEQQLWRLSATEMTALVARRDVSSKELVQSCLQRLEDVNPRINAIVDVLADSALAAATAADEAVARREPTGPLHGVPVTVKVNVDMAGFATTNGVKAFGNLVAHEDSPVVANLRKAGAIIIGRNNAPAFSYRWFTDNDLYGRTLNPWHPGLTPGGSSGGAAAAVAAGIGPIAHGNDLGGSIRYPAYACGVAGLRPTSGRVPAYNPTQSHDRTLAVQLASVQGPLARTVGDLRLALSAMAAPDSRDAWWMPVAPDGGPASTARFPARVAVCPSIPGVPTDPVVADAVRQAARWLEDAGCLVEEVVPPRLNEASDLWLALVTNEAVSGLGKTIETHGDQAIRNTFASQRRLATPLDLAGYMNGLAQRTGLLREWQAFFQQYPLLLMPVSCEQPFAIDEDQRGDDVFRRILDAQGPLLATALLGLPGLSVPTGVRDGVPTGIQIVAGRFQEALCLAAGEAIEARAGICTPIDPVGAARQEA
ncbi:amidase family protein [Burkholderia lata]|uniref:Amidase n=1 Tax=Burkholderia lata (strain ATCC 17760 / DSM 23089 / LMG 22485 / NCIMB 9086 / R18194 / 383) TaxID=482957 RepID=Q39P97_BURL3|nr:amidase family protein [Burkholderia lata]ABB05719.1 Amidase [Burkholderia lata]